MKIRYEEVFFSLKEIKFSLVNCGTGDPIRDQVHSHITIVWPTFYVNNGDFTAFRARYFNSLH